MKNDITFKIVIVFLLVKGYYDKFNDDKFVFLLFSDKLRVIKTKWKYKFCTNLQEVTSCGLNFIFKLKSFAKTIIAWNLTVIFEIDVSLNEKLTIFV